MITELLCSWRLPNFIFSYSKQTTYKELITILQKWLLWEAPFFLSIQWLQNTTQRFLDTSVLILSYLYMRIVGKKQIFSAEAWNAIPWAFFRISKLLSFTEYFSLTLVFIWNGTLRKSLVSVFQEISASINKIFILAGRLGTRLSFNEIFTLSWPLRII